MSVCMSGSMHWTWIGLAYFNESVKPTWDSYFTIQVQLALILLPWTLNAWRLLVPVFYMLFMAIWAAVTVYLCFYVLFTLGTIPQLKLFMPPNKLPYSLNARWHQPISPWFLIAFYVQMRNMWYAKDVVRRSCPVMWWGLQNKWHVCVK